MTASANNKFAEVPVHFIIVTGAHVGIFSDGLEDALQATESFGAKADLHPALVGRYPWVSLGKTNYFLRAVRDRGLVN